MALMTETQAKINNGDFKTQADVDAYLETETDKFITTTFEDLKTKVVKKIADNIKTEMDPRKKIWKKMQMIGQQKN